VTTDDKEDALDRLKKIASQVPGLVYQFRMRPDGSCCMPYASAAIVALLRLTPEQVREDASPFFALIHPDDLQLCLASIEESRRNLTQWRSEFRIVFPDKTTRRLGANSIPEREADGATAWHGFITDVTERKLMEEELREAHALNERIINTVPVRVFWKNLDLVYLGCNAEFARDAGCAEPKDVVGKDDYQMGWRAQAELYRKDDRAVIESGLPKLLIEEPQTMPTGEVITLLTNKVPLRNAKGEIIGVLGSYVDFTPRKRTEELREKLQRLESLGTLAGGIAHDFNNILTAILGNLSLFQDEMKGGAPDPELIQEAQNACETAKGLSNQLLTFAQGGSPIITITDLRPVISAAAAFAARGTKARCVFALGDVPLAAGVDKTQVSQVVQNLVINATQAMPDGGTIFVAAAIADAGGNGRVRRVVRVTIADQGPGIAPEALAKIFDPFFSTNGTGRGLGLAICHSIMSKHGGSIRAESEPGAGAIFTFEFPEADAASIPASATPEPLAAGNGRVLIMDDEPAVAKALKRMIEHAGYRADLSKDGEAALKAYRGARDAGDPYDAVILDLTVRGGLGGKETMKKLRALEPAVKALISSGYANDPVMAEYATHGFLGILRKPYRIEEVAAALSLLSGLER
jgi:signal transduction histidine kinase/ActR/RegA family two-component response regulator